VQLTGLSRLTGTTVVSIDPRREKKISYPSEFIVHLIALSNKNELGNRTIIQVGFILVLFTLVASTQKGARSL